MSLLFRVLYTNKCTSTHHKLAMDALRHLQSPHADEWRDLFARHVEIYLDGSKAPDKKFKDFRNHVLHVRDNYWGGAVVAAEKWYQALVALLQEGDWARAVYAAGVLTHYVSDPFMPLHTGQTEEEGAIHRAAEWSVAKTYDELTGVLDDDVSQYPPIELPSDDNWLALTIIDGAQRANVHYETLIDHYCIELGVRNPPAGLDQECRDLLSELLRHTAVTLARILDRSFAAAAVKPPGVRTSLAGFLTTLTIPIFWITRRLTSRHDRAAVRAVYRELQEQGRVIEALPEDDREIRALHAEEILGVTVEELGQTPVRPTGTQHPSALAKAEEERAKAEEEARAAEAAEADDSYEDDQETTGDDSNPFGGGPPPFYLNLDDPVVDAPSIGSGTAKRLRRAGVRTVADLLDCDPDSVADAARASYISQDAIVEWQAQSRLMCRVPGLRGHDAQILVACDISDPETLRKQDPPALLQLIQPFVTSADGERVLRSSPPPDLDEVTNWVNWTHHARTLRAA